MNNEHHNAPLVTPCTGIEAPKASSMSPSVVMYWDGGERAITAREKSVIEEHRASCFSIPLVAVPAGWVLVPERMTLDPSAVDYLATQLGGTEPDSSDVGERWSAGLLWVGETEDDDGKRYHGLNIANLECPEEGSIPLVEFPATSSVARRSVDLLDQQDAVRIDAEGVNVVPPAAFRADNAHAVGINFVNSEVNGNPDLAEVASVHPFGVRLHDDEAVTTHGAGRSKLCTVTPTESGGAGLRQQCCDAYIDGEGSMRAVARRIQPPCNGHLNWFGVNLGSPIDQLAKIHARVIHRHVHVTKDVTNAIHFKSARFRNVPNVPNGLDRTFHVYHTAPSGADRVCVQSIKVVHQHANRPCIQNIELGAELSTLLCIKQRGPHQSDGVSQVGKLSPQRSLCPLRNRPCTAVGCTAAGPFRGQADVEGYQRSCGGSDCRSPTGSLATPKLGDAQNADCRTSTERGSYGRKEHRPTNQFINEASSIHTKVRLGSYYNSATPEGRAHA